MASLQTGNKAVYSVAEMDVLSQMIECSVCFERLDTNSKVLPCQHTFCKDCLDQISNQSKGFFYRCPECRTLCNVPVKDLPANILLVRLLEGMKSAGRHVYSNKEILESAGAACAKALYNYESKEMGDLTFKKGDLIYLRKRLDENWYVGELNGACGSFPAAYVHVICPLPVSSTKRTYNKEGGGLTKSAVPTKVTVTALYDFEMKDEEKEDCLKFKKDDLIQLIRRVDQNWAEGVLGSNVGIFPLNYVKLTEAAKALLDAPQRRFSVPSANAGNRGSGSFNQAPSSISQSVSPENPNITSTQSRGNVLQVPSTPNSVISNQKPADLNLLLVPAQLASIESYDQRQSRSQSSDSSIRMPTMDNTSNSQKQVTFEIYQALFHYIPQKDDELALIKGSFYQVTDKCKDGWYRGISTELGTSGVFPGNYVRALCKEEHLLLNKQSVEENRSISIVPKLENNPDISANNVKQRNPARRNGSVLTGQPKVLRQRSSSLSRLEIHSTSVGQPNEQSHVRGRQLAATKQSLKKKATGQRFMCIAAYNAQKDIDLDLKVGDTVVIVKEESEGWYKGVNEATGKIGVFPASFVN